MDAPELSKEAKDRIRHAIEQAESALTRDLGSIPRPRLPHNTTPEQLQPAFQRLARALYDAHAREYPPASFTAKDRYVIFLMSSLPSKIKDDILGQNGLWGKWAPHSFQLALDPVRKKRFSAALSDVLVDGYHFWKAVHGREADEPKTRAGRGYRTEIKAWMKKNDDTRTQVQAARKLGVSLDTLKAIMRGDASRYSTGTLNSVLEKIIHESA